MPGGTGGLAGGLRSIFAPVDFNTVGPVRLFFVTQPSGGVAGEPLAPVQVRALNGTGTPVAGVQVTLDAAFPETLTGTTTLVTGPDGLATFADLRISRTGEARLKSEGTVVGRPAILVLGRKTDPFTVTAPD
jgi:hypothetical protein